MFRQSSVEGNPDFPAPGRVESELVKLEDVAPAGAMMSYVDRTGVSPGATYIYRVWTLEEDVYVFGEYGAEAVVAIVAADGATAAGGRGSAKSEFVVIILAHAATPAARLGLERGGR